MGLHASIYKDKGQDWSNGGYSSRVDEVTLVNVSGPFEPSNDAPPAMLTQGPRGTVRVVPAIKLADGSYAEVTGTDFFGHNVGGVGPMMGGCYVCTSDSRFAEAVRALGGSYGAVALHDRFETAEQYAALST